jgi:hypothetical protein
LSGNWQEGRKKIASGIVRRHWCIHGDCRGVLEKSIDTQYEINDYHRFIDIMLVLDHESLIMLVPHIEEWVLSEATPISTHLKEPEPFVYHELGREFAVFETGSLMVPDGPAGSMRSIKGLYVGSEFQAGTDKKPENQSQYILRQTRINERLIQMYPVFEESGKGNGEWWLFSGNACDRLGMLGMGVIWFIVVDYQGKRMWGTMCKQKMCFLGMMFGT